MTLILSFLAGLGITIFLLFLLFATVISCAGLIAIIRAAINPALGNLAKIIWIVGSFVPGVAFLYFAFVDKNAFLKFTGWACILFFAVVAITGGAAMQGAVRSFEKGNSVNHWEFKETYPPNLPEKAPDKEVSPDDSSLSL